MGFRFRKTIGKGPFRMTFSKSGVSTSFGGPGARVTKRADGKTQTTLSVPGTGISHTSTNAKNISENVAINATISPKFLWKLFRILAVPTVILGLLFAIINPAVGFCFAGFGITEWFFGGHFKKQIKGDNE